MFRFDGEVFLLGTAMADQLHQLLVAHDQIGSLCAHDDAPASLEGGGQNKARSEPETPSGFKAKSGRYFFNFPNTANGLSGCSSASSGTSKATPGARG